MEFAKKEPFSNHWVLQKEIGKYVGRFAFLAVGVSYK
jgi:hypothetical protein